MKPACFIIVASNAEDVVPHFFSKGEPNRRFPTTGRSKMENTFLNLFVFIFCHHCRLKCHTKIR